MFSVGYKITIGSTTLQLGKANRLLALESSAAIDVPVNRCRIVLDGQSRLSVSAGDPVRVELGYHNNLPIVFTGRLDTIESSFAQICLEARGGFAGLLAARQNGLYEQQSAGAIVGSLLGAQQIAIGTLEKGETFARFSVSDYPTLWSAIYDLGRRCGYDFYADCEDRAVFKRYAPPKTYLFTYGGDILEYNQIGGEQGRDARSRWWLRSLGAPVVHLGDAVQITHMPSSAQNGIFKITGVRHQLDHNINFITDIFWESA